MAKYKQTTYKMPLVEIPQDLNSTMAFVKKLSPTTYTNAHDFVKCRDFLGDAFIALDTKTTKSIYGFSFNGKIDTFLTNKLHLVMCLPNEDTYSNMLQHLTHLHEIESKVGRISKTKLTLLSLDETGGKFMVRVEASKFWLKSVFNISLYTFLLKSLGYTLDKTLPFLEAIGNTSVVKVRWDNTTYIISTVEADYIKAVGHKLVKILPYLIKINKDLPTKHGYDTVVDISTLHNRSGFVSILNGVTDNLISQRCQEYLK